MKSIFAALGLCCAAGICSAEILKNDPDFNKDTRTWCTQSYWSGKLERENNMLKLIPTQKGGKTWIKLLGGLTNQAKYYPGQTLKITVVAKGSGKYFAGLILYSQKNTKIEYVPGKTVTLTPEMKTYTFEFVLRGKPDRLAAYMNLDGTTPAYIKSYKLETVSKPK